MKNSWIAPALLACITLASCNVAYRSNTLNTPLFTQKNEVAVNVNANNLQAAYSVSDHIGIMANGFYERSKVGSNETGNGGYGYVGELGLGYFTPLANPNFIFETYAGAGYGHLYLNNNYNDNGNIESRKLNADGLKFFVQPAIGYKLKNVELSGGVRYSNVNYQQVNTSNWPAAELQSSQLAGIGNTTYHFIEPGLTVRAGLKNVKLQFQYLRCIKLNSEALNFSDYVFSVGLFVKLPTSSNTQ